MKMRCVRCHEEIPSVQELRTHTCYVPDDLDDQIAMANARDFGQAPEREDRYAGRSGLRSSERHCSTCGRVLLPHQDDCDFCRPDNNDFRPMAAMPPQRSWIRASSGVTVYKMTPDEMTEYLKNFDRQEASYHA